ncbi:conserved hypothetical protein; putative exported protein [Marinobacter nauticus ATCC 49840]|uniref:hypothetical protein n=1 Tax=Marinobacter nauticus TaxID=2743 RepID=UPI000256F0C4|nr:hypothetical protein [Marinobacter nauticus]CCG96325.1 conserved hypothetical protein; putative exported protein [Marinobacter nauticus ATCC 49840]
MMPDSAWLQGALRKAVAAIIGFMLLFVLLLALLITGIYLLVNAATLALSPWVGEAGAMALTGTFCFLLLLLVLYRLSRPGKPGSSDSGSSSAARSPTNLLLDVIRKNPLEAASVAFALGVVEQGDPRLKALLLQGGMVLMKDAQSSPDNPADSGDDEVQSSPS